MATYIHTYLVFVVSIDREAAENFRIFFFLTATARDETGDVVRKQTFEYLQDG